MIYLGSRTKEGINTNTSCNCSSLQYCENNICKNKKAPTGSCDSHEICISGICDIKTGKCKKGIVGNGCTDGNQCESGSCNTTKNICNGESSCKSPYILKNGLCLKKSASEQCANSNDCMTNECISNKCSGFKLKLGERCSNGYDCVSGVCKKGNFCGSNQNEKCYEDSDCKIGTKCINQKCN